MLQATIVASLTGVFGLGFAGGRASAQPVSSKMEAAKDSFYLGSWQDSTDSGYRIRIEPTRILVSFGGQVQSVFKVLSSSPGRIQVCDFGRDKAREVARDGQELILREPETGQRRRLRRLTETPLDLNLKPLAIPEPRPLPEERVLAIQKELWGRLQEDQQAIGGIHIPAGSEGPSWLAPKEAPKFVADDRALRRAATFVANTRYLKNLISEIGWIDVQRFGYPASNAAFLLVQHSYDLPLMMAVLPKIKEDVDAGRTEGEPYALLYDRLQLALGEKQLYGSQVFIDEYGERAILPVAEPDRLAERRASLHMQPIAEYMQAWGNTEVRISSACSGEGSITYHPE